MIVCLWGLRRNGQKIDSIAYWLCFHSDITEGLKLLHQLGISTNK